MTRLIDRLRESKPREAHGYNPPDRDELVDRLAGELDQAEAFVIDNVADYWDEVHGWQRPFEMSDFPNVAPPFGQWWMEYRMADEQGHRISDDLRVGALFSAWDDQDRDAWVIACEPYMSGPGLTIGPIDRVHVVADRSGRLLDLLGPAGVRPEERQADDLIATYALLRPMFLAVSFLHCRNMTTRAVVPDAKLNRARARRHKPPLRTYKVLQIQPMAGVLEAEGNIRADGLARALHICRGHFKTYDEHPLFGQLRGTWFWRDYVRGSAAAGVADKDYAVNAPAAGPAEVGAAASRRFGRSPS